MLYMFKDSFFVYNVSRIMMKTGRAFIVSWKNTCDEVWTIEDSQTESPSLRTYFVVSHSF